MSTGPIIPSYPAQAIKGLNYSEQQYVPKQFKSIECPYPQTVTEIVSGAHPDGAFNYIEIRCSENSRDSVDIRWDNTEPRTDTHKCNDMGTRGMRGYQSNSGKKEGIGAIEICDTKNPGQWGPASLSGSSACKPGEYVVGIHGYHQTEGTNRHFTQLGFICRPAPPAATTPPPTPSPPTTPTKLPSNAGDSTSATSGTASGTSSGTGTTNAPNTQPKVTQPPAVATGASTTAPPANTNTPLIIGGVVVYLCFCMLCIMMIGLLMYMGRKK